MAAPLVSKTHKYERGQTPHWCCPSPFPSLPVSPLQLVLITPHIAHRRDTMSSLILLSLNMRLNSGTCFPSRNPVRGGSQFSSRVYHREQATRHTQGERIEISLRRQSTSWRVPALYGRNGSNEVLVTFLQKLPAVFCGLLGKKAAVEIFPTFQLVRRLLLLAFSVGRRPHPCAST
jgi:hypothetical protein